MTSNSSEKQSMMDDLYNVGNSKMLGYLPLHTLTQYCGEDLEKVKRQLLSKDLFIDIFEGHKCNILGGAMYVADLKTLQNFLLAPPQKKTLETAQWPTDAKLFIHQVAKVQARNGTELYDLIAMTFNDPLLTKEQQLHAYPKEAQNNIPQEAVYNFTAGKISQIREKINNDSSLINLENIAQKSKL